MILRPQSLPAALLLLLPSLVSAQGNGDPFNCHVQTNTLTFDLTKLAGEHDISRLRQTPPSAMEDSLSFNLCADLKPRDGIADGDQCPSGTRACLTKINKKTGNSDRIVAVVPLAQSSSLNPQYSALSSPKGLSLILHGASYPSAPSTTPIPQSLNVTFLCSDTPSTANITSYDGGMMNVAWSHPAGCGVAGNDDSSGGGGGNGGGSGNENKGGGKEKSVGSGIGWFFLVLLLAFIAYFALGAYYNYTTYGASGIDLIPHRDFWQEVPYMARDVISHLCSSVRPRRTSAREGYIAV